MELTDYFRYIAEEIHTVIMATVDDEGKPVTAAIDIMDWDDEGLYFLTATGKNFYDRLKKRQFLAFTALKGEDTMSSVAVSVRGCVREIGSERLGRLFEKNPYMAVIYPTESSRQALTVFQICEGEGEWFDLSKKPIERESFAFGGERVHGTGYEITQNCTGCGACLDRCPQDCIVTGSVPYVIRQENCLHCGGCRDVCPAGAVIRKEIG